MKKVFKIIGYIFLTLIVGLTAAFFYYNEKMPVGIKGAKAEALAQKMVQAVNKAAWDTTAIVGWTSRMGNVYIWDKKRNLVQIESKTTKTLLNVNKQSGKVWENQTEVTDPAQAEKGIQNGYKAFINDAFWLNPVVKVFDEGTERSLVTLPDNTDGTSRENREGVLVTYKSGGVTPGDTYLWLVDANGVPTAWKFWVKILPIGGIQFSWEDWLTLPTGAKVATTHKGNSGGFAITFKDIKSAQNLSDFGLKDDIFAGIQ
jgi:hypothetical protein